MTSNILSTFKSEMYELNDFVAGQGFGKPPVDKGSGGGKGSSGGRGKDKAKRKARQTAKKVGGVFDNQKVMKAPSIPGKMPSPAIAEAPGGKLAVGSSSKKASNTVGKAIGDKAKQVGKAFKNVAGSKAGKIGAGLAATAGVAAGAAALLRANKKKK